MTPAKFLETHTPIWDRLAELVSVAGRKGPGKLSQAQLTELARLYPVVAVDVARARMYRLDAASQNRLGQIAIAAHGLLYRRPSVRPVEAIGRFFRVEYPRLFRRMRAYVLLSVAIFSVVMLSTYAAVRIRPSVAHVIVPSGLEVETPGRVTGEDVSERYRRTPKPIMDSYITTNNIQVAFFAFALGVLAGIGTCYVLLLNAMMLGAFFAHFANHGLSGMCYSFLIPHGALEIFAIVVAGAAGLRLGLSLALPGRLTRKASLRRGAKEGVLLVLGTIPMFVVAGVLESFVTPTYWPGAVKIVIGLLALGLTLAYLLLVGREVEDRPAPASATADASL